VFVQLINLLACPNCKDTLEVQVAAGYAWSIGLMILIPWLILAGWSVAVARQKRVRSQIGNLGN